MFSFFFFCHCFLQSIVFIHGDCLEFDIDESSKINECSIQTKSFEISNFDSHYPECLICRIESSFISKNVSIEKENRCSKIELRCIQMSFLNRNLFEEFYVDHRTLINELFFKQNQIDQNTLHLIFEEKSFDELNQNDINEYFPENESNFRALILEFRKENRTLKLNRDLIGISHLSIEIILSCSKEIKRDEETIYIIHHGEILIEQENRNCSANFVSNLSTTTMIDNFSSTSTETSTVLLSPSKENSTKSLLIVLLIGGILSSVALISTFFFWKYCRKFPKINQEETSETNSELSTHDDDRSVESVLPKEPLPKTIKKPTKMMNSRLIWLDDL